MKNKNQYYKNLVDICRHYDMNYGFTNYKPFHSQSLDWVTGGVLQKIWSCEYQNYQSETPISQEEVLEKVFGKLDPTPKITWVFFELDEWSEKNFIKPFGNNEERIKLWTYICLEYVKINLDEIYEKTRINDPHYRNMRNYKIIPQNFGFTDEAMDRIFKWLDRKLQK